MSIDKHGDGTPVPFKKMDISPPKVSLNETHDGHKNTRQKRLSTFVAEQSRLFEARSQNQEREHYNDLIANELSGKINTKSYYNPISQERVSLKQDHNNLDVKAKLNQDNNKSTPKRNFLNKFNCVLHHTNLSSSEEDTEEGNKEAESKNIDKNSVMNLHVEKFEEYSDKNTVLKLSQRKPIVFSNEFTLDSSPNKKPLTSLPSETTCTQKNETSRHKNFEHDLKSSENLFSKIESIASLKTQLRNKMSHSPLPSSVIEAKQMLTRIEERSSSPERKHSAMMSFKKGPTYSSDKKEEHIFCPSEDAGHTGNVMTEMIVGSSYSNKSKSENVPPKYESTSVDLVKKELQDKISSSKFQSKPYEANQSSETSIGSSKSLSVEYEATNTFGVNKTEEFKLKYSNNVNTVSVKELQTNTKNLSKEEKILKKLQINYSTVNKLLSTENDDDCQIDSDEMEDFKNTLTDAKTLLNSYEVKIKELDSKLPFQKLNNIRKNVEDIRKQIDIFRGLRRDSSYGDILKKIKLSEQNLTLISNRIKEKQEISENLKLGLILLEDKANVNELLLCDILNDLVDLISKRRIKETYL